MFPFGQFEQLAIEGPLLPPFHLDLVLLAALGVLPGDVAAKRLSTFESLPALIADKVVFVGRCHVIRLPTLGALWGRSLLFRFGVHREGGVLFRGGTLQAVAALCHRVRKYGRA
jgi:hypothetical protein